AGLGYSGAGCQDRQAARGASCQGISRPHVRDIQSHRQTRQVVLIATALTIGIRMKNVRNNEVADRRSSSAEAKAALLNAYRAAKTATEPARIARQAERAAIANAREERRVERER